MQEEVLEFINRRFKKDCDWMNGNCYYFAKILQVRFPKLEIVYFPIEGHFMAWDRKENLFYDATGAHCANGKPFNEWEKMRTEEPFWYYRLMSDCVI